MFGRMRGIDFYEDIKKQAREDARKNGDKWIGAVGSDEQKIYEAEYNREVAKILLEENPELVLETMREMDLV